MRERVRVSVRVRVRVRGGEGVSGYLWEAPGALSRMVRGMGSEFCSISGAWITMCQPAGAHYPLTHMHAV